MNPAVFGASFAALWSFCLLPATPAVAQSTTVAIRNVTVVDVPDGSLRPNQTVPLEDITNTRRIRAVVAGGRLYRRSDLDRLLNEVEASIRRGRES